MKDYNFNCGEGDYCSCKKENKKKIPYAKIFWGTIVLGITLNAAYQQFWGSGSRKEVKIEQVGKSIDSLLYNNSFKVQ
jgi:hypothetical protein